jgi:hypothetical protein
MTQQQQQQEKVKLVLMDIIKIAAITKEKQPSLGFFLVDLKLRGRL